MTTEFDDNWLVTIRSRKYLAVGITCVFGWATTYLAVIVLKDYAFGLFIWLPMVMGILSTLIYGYKNSVKRKQLRNITYYTLFLFCIGLLVFAFEGMICIAMAAPLGVLFSYVGFLIGKAFLDKKKTSVPLVAILFALSAPALMAFENSVPDREDLRFVKTSIEINATPETVWKNIVAFPQLKEPTEFIFKTGIAYPINATIDGQGVGAIRHCNFSTGPFVEPITIWDQPRLLEFSVLDQPETMKEVSPYNIRPNHIYGYWVSKRGQFKLTKLPNNHTLVEGTTWYVNKIKPDIYWTLWSDYIVHKIHTRVLQHIKEQAEK